jgi:PAS domain S-box-containing protein
MDQPKAPREPRGPWFDVLVVVLSLVGLWAAYVVQRESDLGSKAVAQLESLAEVKAERISAWREERLSNGRSISAHPLVARLAHQIEGGLQPERTRADLAAWCRSRMQHQEYVGVSVFGARGDLLASAGLRHDHLVPAEVAAAMRAGQVALSNLHRDTAGTVHVDLFAPLWLEESGAPRLVGLAALRIDPQRVLTSVVLGSPLGQARATSALLDQSGGEVLPTGTELPGGLQRELALSSEEVDTVATLETVDAAGAPLLAARRPVPGAPWSLLVTADRGEAFAPLRAMALRSLVVVAIAIGALLVSRTYWFRRRLRESRLRQAAAEAERQALQRRFEDFSNHSTDAILVADGDCNIVQANDRATTLYGLPRSSLVGLNMRDLLEPGTAGDHDLRKHQVDLEGAIRFEARQRRGDGAELSVDVLAHAVEIDGRRYYQSVIRDTTERKQAEAALRASEEKFRTAFFDAPVGTALVDQAGRFIEFNAALARMLGRGTEELQRTRFGELLHPEDRAASLAAFGSLLSGERDHNHMERRYLRGNGDVLHARYSVSAVRDGDGRFLYAMAIIQDVTAQVLGEEALRASEERFRLALDATDDGIWDWDIQRDALHVSDHWLARLGYRREEVASIAATVALVHEEDRQAFLEHIQANLMGREASFAVEHRLATRGGEWRWVMTRGKIVSRDVDGAPLRAVGSQTDVTERKRLQASLHLADRMATVGTLAAGVAHEINNPLAWISASLDYAKEAMAHLAARDGGAGHAAKELNEAHQALDDAREGVGRIGRIAQDLKTFSRSDDEWASVDLRRTVESSIRFASRAIAQRARLVRDFQDVPPVIGAEGRLSQVFLNLLLNAAQAITEGRPDENVVTVRVGSAGGQVRVEIRDTGCGIPAEQQGKIFDPFFTTKPAGIGTGLGLSICREYVETHGGRIELESEVGRGSTFAVILPAAGPTPARPGPAALPPPQAVRADH